MKTEITHGTCLPPEAYIRLAKLADYHPKFRSFVFPKSSVTTNTKKENEK